MKIDIFEDNLCSILMTSKEAQSPAFLHGGGKMGELVRGKDWSNTPIGAPHSWPVSLQTSVNILLNSQFPMFVWWGKELTTIYNDAYIPIAGEKHPSLLGKSGRDGWLEIWDALSPLVESVFKGKATWSEDQVLYMNRHGYVEETYFTFSYSPIMNEYGEVSGLFCACIETTEKVFANRKIRESETRFRRMVEQAPVAITLTRSEDLIVETINKPMLQIFMKANEDEVIGKKLIDILPEIKDQPIIETVLNVLHTGEAFKGSEVPVERMINGKLETRFYDLSYTAVVEDDVITSVLQVAIDVTEQKKARKKIEESEEKYRTLFESMDQGFCVLDIIFDEQNKAQDYRFVEVNPVFEEQTGLKNAIGKTALELVPNLERYWLDTYEKVALTGEPTRFIQGSAAMGRWFDVYAFKPGNDASKKIALLFTDITERRANEQALRRSEENFRNMIEQAPVAMSVLLGPSHVVEVANKPIIELWGKTAEAVINKPVFEALPEAREQGLEDLLAHVYNTGETFKAEERPVSLLRDGKLDTVYLNFVYAPYLNSEGKVIGVLASAIDVTLQVLSRKKIEEQREELHLALEIGELGTFYVDLHLNTGFYTKRIKHWFGFEEDKLSMDTIFAAVHPKDQKRVVDVIKASLTNEEAGNHDITYRVINPKDGKERHLRSIGKTFFDGNGKAYQVRGVIQDVTAQIEYQRKIEESEADLQKRVAERTLELQTQKNLLDNILQNSSNGISVTEMLRDSEGNVIDAATILANEAAIKYTGLPKDIYLTMTARQLDPDILTSPYGQTCLRTLETGEPSLIQYYLEFTKRWLELTISKMDEDHLIHIFTDVTTIKESQLQLERSIEDLKRVNANLEEFTYAASHDMKEPIRKIHFFADRLKGELKENLSDNQKHLFDRLENASKRMGFLIDDLLAYSHTTKGTSDVEEIDLNQKVKNVLDDLELEVQQKGAQITVEHLPSIKGNRRQFQQLFQNLISNALKYTKPGEAPQIHISYKTVKGRDVRENLPGEEANKIFHLIEIRDNGIGFSPNDAEKIFNLFTRLHNNSEYRGTGIGLSIVSKVAENHRGFVIAEGEPGIGATFKVALPVE